MRRPVDDAARRKGFPEHGQDFQRMPDARQLLQSEVLEPVAVPHVLDAGVGDGAIAAHLEAGQL